MTRILDKATITSIDRTTGRIGLFLRNGLETTGTYLYDINDLRVGMVVIVGRVNNAYMIFQNMSGNMPSTATKSYSLMEGQSSVGFIDYFHDNLTPANNDEFDGEEINEDIWILTEDPKICEKFCWWYWNEFWNGKNHPEYLKLWDGKLYLDRWCKMSAEAVLEYKPWLTGNFDVEIKATVVCKKCLTPYINSYGGAAYGPYGWQSWYDFPDYGDSLWADSEKIVVSFIRLVRENTMWRAYFKKEVGGSWNLIHSRELGNNPVKVSLNIIQKCFDTSGGVNEHFLGVRIGIMDSVYYTNYSEYGGWFDARVFGEAYKDIVFNGNVLYSYGEINPIYV